MHRITSHKRILALAIPAALAAALMALVLFSGGSGVTGVTRTLAAATPGPLPNLTGISCSQQYVDVGYPNSYPGSPNGLADDINGSGGLADENDATGLTMARIEPHGGTTVTTSWDVTTVSYLGKDLAKGDEIPNTGNPGNDAISGILNDLTPDGPPGPGCQTTAATALTGAEANTLNTAYAPPYANQYGVRATAVGTYTPCVGGLPAPDCTGQPAGSGVLKFSTCAYSETESVWVRVDSLNHIVKTGPGAKNEGTGTLYFAAVPPSAANSVDTNGDGVKDRALDGTDCADGGVGVTFPFSYLTKAHNMDATTDHTAANDGACAGDTACLRNRALGIAQDVDGPHPKAKGDQVPDGTNETTFVADDWDGDGCPNWDELGNGYMPVSLPLLYPPTNDPATHPVNGLDPFNPNDCDQNFGSNISLSTTVIHDTNVCSLIDVINSVCVGNGQFFHCLADVTDGKGAGNRPLTFRLGCYSDSTVTVINSSYDRAYAPGLGEDGHPPGTCNDGINNIPPTPPATPDLVKDAQDSDCHASTCATGLAPADQCGDGKSAPPPPGCRSAPTEPTPVPPCDNSLPYAATPAASHCPAVNQGPGFFYNVLIPCHPERWIYTGITAAEYPVVAVGDATHNYYDATANQIHIGGCFAGLGGPAFGPNVYGAGLIDAHTGVGSFKLWIGRADCTVPLETEGHITGTVSIVELQSKKYVTGPNLGQPLPCIQFGVCTLYDSDKDGCPDSLELSPPPNAQVTGGLRDPYNKWDFFDPFKGDNARKHNALDILIVQQHFGDNEWIKNPADQTLPPVLNDGIINPAIPAYSPNYDRTGIPGGNNWNLGPGDGYIKATDMLIAQKSYGHNCPNM